MRAPTGILFVFLAVSAGSGQEPNWAQVHREDEAKWAHNTGLPPSVIHGLWRTSSHYADEADDDLRIELVEVKKVDVALTFTTVSSRLQFQTGPSGNRWLLHGIDMLGMVQVTDLLERDTRVRLRPDRRHSR